MSGLRLRGAGHPNRYLPCPRSRAVHRSRTHRTGALTLGSGQQRRCALRGAQREDPPKRALFALILDCALPALLQAIFSRHCVFEEILVLRCEAFRKLENLKAVAIADGPELDTG